MSFLNNISFPATPEGKAVSKYLIFQHTRDFSKGEEIFTEDVIFNGLLYKAKGRDELIKGFQDFVDNMLTSIRVEAANEAGTDKYMALCFSRMMGSDDEVPVCDLLTMRDGKICRVDNCFDTSKVSQAMVDDAKAMSTK